MAPESEHISWERIDSKDPRYKEVIEKNKSRVARHLFGLQEFNMLNSCQEEIEKNPEDKDFYESVMQSFLHLSQKELQNIAQRDGGISFENLIYEVIDKNEDIKKQLLEIFPNAFLHTEEIGLMIENVPEMVEGITKIPLDLYKRILEVHIEEYQEKEKNLQEKIPAMQARFIERLKKSMPSLDMEKIEKKIAGIKVVAGDFLLYSDFTLADGDYNPDSQTAVLPSGEITIVRQGNRNFEDYQEYVYTHEMLHGVSGLAVLGSKTKEEKAFETQLQRLGLLVMGRFRWLNEAITERLSLKLTARQDSISYEDERFILQSMIDGGVPEELFFEAYFQDQKSDKGSEAMNRLIKTINKELGPRYLQNLDEAIDVYGVDVVAQEIEEESGD